MNNEITMITTIITIDDIMDEVLDELIFGFFYESEIYKIRIVNKRFVIITSYIQILK